MLLAHLVCPKPHPWITRFHRE